MHRRVHVMSAMALILMGGFIWRLMLVFLPDVHDSVFWPISRVIVLQLFIGGSAIWIFGCHLLKIAYRRTKGPDG